MTDFYIFDRKNSFTKIFSIFIGGDNHKWDNGLFMFDGTTDLANPTNTNTQRRRAKKNQKSTLRTTVERKEKEGSVTKR